MSKSDPADWPRLVEVFDQWCLLDQPGPSGGLDVDKLARRLPFPVPVWFKGCLRARDKVRLKTSLPHDFLATTALAEMASCEAVARHRFASAGPTRAGLRRVFLPACGLGLDAAHYLRHVGISEYVEVIVNDIDLLALEMARHNLGRIHPDLDIRHECGDFLELAAGLCGPDAYCYLDPARREAAGRLPRGSYEPPLEESMALLERFGLAQIKLSPGENPADLAERFPGWRFDVVEYEREVKEISGTWKGPAGPAVSASRLLSATSPANTFCAEPASAIVARQDWQTGTTCHLPCPALLKSGLLASWAQAHGLALCRGQHAVALGLPAPADGLCDSYNTLAMAPARPAALRDMLSGQEGFAFGLRSIGPAPEPALLKALAPFLGQSGPRGRLMVLHTTIDRSRQLFLLEPLNWETTVGIKKNN